MAISAQQIAKIYGIINRIKKEGPKFVNSLNEKGKSEILELIEAVKEADPSAEAMLKNVLKEIIATGTSDSYNSLLSQDWIRTPVDIHTFVNDEAYLGKYGKELYPVWKDGLKVIFNPLSQIYEVILTGAIGIGKNTMSSFCLVYLLYRLSCLVNPAEYFGLMTGSSIVFGIYSVSLGKAKNITFSRIREMTEGSPYFHKYFRRTTKRNTELNFPNNIKIIFGSRQLHAISENILAFELDEANFMHNTESSSQAYDLYSACTRRMESRFASNGRMPGLILCISSRKTKGDFLDKHISDTIKKPHCYFAEYSSWEAKPEKYSKKKFPVFKGDKLSNPKILIPEDVGRYSPADIIMVPENLRGHFELNIEDSLRDLAGVSVSSASPLLRDREALMESIDVSRKHPFTQEAISISNLMPGIVQDYVNEDDLFCIRLSEKCPIVRKSAARFIHIDLSRTGDSTGIAMGHVSSFDEVHSAREGDRFIKPHIYIDFMLRIDPPDKGEICFEKIRDFVYFLRKRKFKIEKITYDSYGSPDSVQLLQAAGFKSEIFSVDRTDLPYVMLRNAILERRLHIYKYDPFIEEITNLIHNREKEKVDHPDGFYEYKGKTRAFSKDVSDCVAAVTYHCIKYVSDNRHLFNSHTAAFLDTDGDSLLVDTINKIGPKSIFDNRDLFRNDFLRRTLEKATEFKELPSANAKSV